MLSPILPVPLPFFYIALFIVCAIILVLQIQFKDQMPWPAPGTVGYDRGPWCEEERTRDFLREPANCLSDLSYCIVGMYMLHCAWYDRNSLRGDHTFPPRNLLLTQPCISLFFGIANLVHFLGTFGNHACGCHTGHVIDTAGMLGVLYIILLYNCWRITLASRTCVPQLSLFAALWLGGMGLLIWYADTYYSDPSCEMKETLGVVVLASAILGTYGALWFYLRPAAVRSGNLQPRLALYALASLLAGTVFHTADKLTLWCWPRSLVNGHALWHLFGAFGLMSLYVEFRSEIVSASCDKASAAALFTAACSRR